MSNAAWFLPSLLALTIWGVTAFLPKIVLRRMKPLHMIVFTSSFFFVGAAAVQVLFPGDFRFEPRGALWAALTGACGTLGQIFYLEALRRGPVTYVSLVSSLYPLVTALLAFTILHEPLTLRQASGVTLGIGAIVLLVLASDKEIPAPAARDDKQA